MERKAIVFWNNLNNSAKDLGKVADTWKPGKLRRVRALNDLSTSREEIFDDEFTTCEFPGDLSDDDDALTEWNLSFKDVLYFSCTKNFQCVCDQFSELFNKGKTDSVSAQRIICIKRVFHCFHFSLLILCQSHHYC